MCLCIYQRIYHITVISLACLSDILVPFQAIKNEVKLFSKKRKEIKTRIKALAKTVKYYDFINLHASPQSKIPF